MPSQILCSERGVNNTPPMTGGTYQPHGFARPAELAEYFRISLSTLFRWTRDGYLPSPAIRRKSYTAWRWADIYAWDEARKREGSQ